MLQDAAASMDQNLLDSLERLRDRAGEFKIPTLPLHTLVKNALDENSVSHNGHNSETLEMFFDVGDLVVEVIKRYQCSRYHENIQSLEFRLCLVVCKERSGDRHSNIPVAVHFSHQKISMYLPDPKLSMCNCATNSSSNHVTQNAKTCLSGTALQVTFLRSVLDCININKGDNTYMHDESTVHWALCRDEGDSFAKCQELHHDDKTEINHSIFITQVGNMVTINTKDFPQIKSRCHQ